MVNVISEVSGYIFYPTKGAIKSVVGRENLLILQIKKARAADIKGPEESSILHGRNTFLRRKLLAVFLHLIAKDWPPIYTRYEGQCGR